MTGRHVIVRIPVGRKVFDTKAGSNTDATIFEILNTAVFNRYILDLLFTPTNNNTNRDIIPTVQRSALAVQMRITRR